ncbi:MAG: M3 family metallopeptidase [Bacteroidales bacterium]|jgi:peptidyl-dipeptidase Dcp|nr:M3 family metallopeptidase [Bacteroidales bacterium]MDD3272430.1 M3 family metallopeptidase [Bacteroidales bacterium]MDD4057586.1 M3 family metallopeptidase [Bacteroidales bacterium]
MKKLLFVMIAAGALFTSCSQKGSNPLLEEWNTPFGIPPFEEIKIEHFMPAFVEAMDQHKAEIDAIVNNTEEPTFENTIVAYDNAGALLDKISPVFSHISGTNSNADVIALEKELSPLRSKHFNEISLNQGLFERVKTVYTQKDSLGLDLEQMRLLEEMFKGFVRSGADLPEDKKEALKEINQEISALQLKFGQNLLSETGSYKLVIDSESDLSGLSEALKTSALARGEKDSATAGKWVFGLDNPSIIPFLQQADNRELRREILNAYLNRCNNNNEFDNKEVIKRLVDLRLQRAKLLGFENFAQYQLETRMAKTEENVYNLLNKLWTPALASAKRELADMKAIAKADGLKGDLEAADWRYYFEKAMAKKFDLSDAQLRPYFKMENVRDGIFYLSKQLYGITFTQLDNVPMPHSESTVFECKDEDGSHLGIIYMDMFARPGEKRGGAWCSGFRSQTYRNGERVAPLVLIVGNFTRPNGDEPALLSTDEVGTFFHEFGHALASLLKDVHYYGVGGMTRDFVELPSQIMEHWTFEPQLLKEYAKHYQTGEVIPQELVDKIVNSGKYGQGFATTEYLAASLLDMDFHVLKEIPADLDVTAFEAKVLSDRGLINQIPPRYRSTYFSHTFGGGYTAGYYSYIWAEVLDSDAYQAFVETGDIFNKEVAQKFRKEVLARAGQDDAMKLYVNFRGKEPGIEPLLKNRGLK